MGRSGECVLKEGVAAESEEAVSAGCSQRKPWEATRQGEAVALEGRTRPAGRASSGAADGGKKRVLAPVAVGATSLGLEDADSW